MAYTRLVYDTPWENYYQTYDSSIWYCPLGVGNLYADKYYFTTGEVPPDTYMEKIIQGCYHSAPRVLRKDFTNYYLLPMAGSFY